MSSEMTETPDQRVALTLGTHHEQVRQARDRLNNEPLGTIQKAIILDRIRQHVLEAERKLRNVSPDNLLKVQGTLDGLDLAISVLAQPITDK